MRYLAHHDVLTSTLNRASFQEALLQAARRRAEGGPGFAVLCIDLDGFKEVNDTLGHAAGDDMLRQVAQRLHDTMRNADLVARLGGDEFLIALRDVGPDDAVLIQVMRGLIDGLSLPIRLSTGEEVRVGVSIGIACLPEQGTDPQALVRAADDALYHVKRNGKQAFALAISG